MLVRFRQTGNDLSVTFVALATWLPSLHDSFGWTSRDDDRVLSALACLIRRVERCHRRSHQIALSLRLEGQTSTDATATSLSAVGVVKVAEVI